MSSNLPKREHYQKGYDTLERFISYYYQIAEVAETGAKRVLEVGCGNKTFYTLMKNKDVDIISIDVNKSLEPDIVGDVRKMPFKNEEFDVVTAFQVLEHLPFREFEKALKELKRVSKNKVIISLPYSSMNIDIVKSISLPFIKKRLRLKISMPYFFVKIKIDQKNKEHYWEMGRKGYPKRNIKNLLKKHFNIEKEFSPALNSYHYFFVLSKK